MTADQRSARSEKRPTSLRRKGKQTTVPLSLEEKDQLRDLLLRLEENSPAENSFHASDILHSAVMLAIEAGDSIEVEDIPWRGSWGSEAATQFRDRFKYEVSRALAVSHFEQYPEDVGAVFEALRRR